MYTFKLPRRSHTHTSPPRSSTSPPVNSFSIAYLSRHPGTFYLRLSLLPLVLYWEHIFVSYMWHRVKVSIWSACHYCANSVLIERILSVGLFAELISGKAIDFAWRRKGMLKADETKPGVSSKSSSVSQCANGGSDNGAPSAECKEEISSYTAPPWLHDTLEIACTSRGLGWQFGADLYIPNDPRPSERAVGFGPLSTILNGRGYLILWVSESSHMMWFVTYSARPTSNMEESFFWS